MSDDPIMAALARLEAGQTKLRVDVMDRIDRLQNVVIAIRDDIAVNSGSVEQMDRINDTTRSDMRQMREQMYVMWKQLKQAQEDIRTLKGD